MKLKDLFVWPPKCASCGSKVKQWNAAGLAGAHWYHNQCWMRLAETTTDELVPALDGVGSSRLPMILFLLMLHVGGGSAVFGWFSINQANGAGVDSIVSYLALTLGLAVLLLGILGFVLEILIRTRIEEVRQAVDKNRRNQPKGAT